MMTRRWNKEDEPRRSSFRPYTATLTGGPGNAWALHLVQVSNETDDYWEGKKWHPVECRWEPKVEKFLKGEYTKA